MGRRVYQEGEKNLKLSRWIEAVVFHPAGFLPPVLGDWVERGTIVAAAAV